MQTPNKHCLIQWMMHQCLLYMNDASCSQQYLWKKLYALWHRSCASLRLFCNNKFHYFHASNKNTANIAKCITWRMSFQYMYKFFITYQTDNLECWLILLSIRTVWTRYFTMNNYNDFVLSKCNFLNTVHNCQKHCAKNSVPWVWP